MTIHHKLFIIIVLSLFSLNLVGQFKYQDFSSKGNYQSLRNIEFWNTQEVKYTGEVRDTVFDMTMTGKSYEVKSYVLLWYICYFWETESEYDTLYFQLNVYKDEEHSAFNTLTDSLNSYWSNELKYFESHPYREFPSEDDFINPTITINKKNGKDVIFAFYEGGKADSYPTFYISTKKKLIVIKYLPKVRGNPYSGIGTFCQDHIRLNYPLSKFRYGERKEFKVRKFLSHYESIRK